MSEPKKILVVDYPSFIEQSVCGLPCTAAIYDADIIVNPTYGSVIGKTIIVNLPISIPLEQLKDHNKIISRFPISSDIEIQLFPMPENRAEVTADEMSCIILSKDIVNDPRYIELVHYSKFLVGTNTECDGGITAVGYILLKNRIEDL